MPILSIIIPCYNYGQYLKDSLDSVLAQDFSDFEIVLVNDGSTDQTPEICEAYSNEFTNVRYICCTKNLGVFRAVQIGLEAAQGEYVHYFSADDKYLPGFLSKSMHLLQSNAQFKLVCSDVGYFETRSPDKIVSKQPVKAFSESTYLPPLELPAVCRKTGFWIAGTTCIVKRELVAQYGNYDPKLENIADWFLFHKIAFHEGVSYIPETLIAMRTHPQAYTARVKKDKQRKRATYHHLLHLLLQDENLRTCFCEGGLLDFIFKDLKWKLYFHPHYRRYWRRPE